MTWPDREALGEAAYRGAYDPQEPDEEACPASTTRRETSPTERINDDPHLVEVTYERTVRYLCEKPAGHHSPHWNAAIGSFGDPDDDDNPF